ncbi:hypothetical protein VPH35_065344 [Triticum aestivum]|uniref:Uncharacterized protein n=1 Tax=Triticum urartu TaxID=4572 RepID=A0A8R7U796_TRIUA
MRAAPRLEPHRALHREAMARASKGSCATHESRRGSGDAPCRGRPWLLAAVSQRARARAPRVRGGSLGGSTGRGAPHQGAVHAEMADVLERKAPLRISMISLPFFSFSCHSISSEI